MTDMPWQPPHPPLRGRALAALALGAAVTTVLSVLVTGAAASSGTLPVKALLVFGAIALIVIGHLEAHHPFDHFGAANITTTCRAVFVALVAAFVGEPRSETAAAIAATAAVAAVALDGVDGWLARRTGVASAFGARFDMEIDALLILALAVLAWQYNKAGWWIVLAGLMRYLFIAAGYGWRWMDAALPPSLRRKAVCVAQIVGLCIVVSPAVAPPISTAIAATTLAALAYSFLVDTLWLRRHGG
jgi:phosphatidylglycerophosphate synthase